MAPHSPQRWRLPLRADDPDSMAARPRGASGESARRRSRCAVSGSPRQFDLFGVVPVDGPTALGCSSSHRPTVHHPVGNVPSTVILKSFGNGGRQLRARTKRDAKNNRHGPRDGIQRAYGVALCRSTHALDQRHRLVYRKALAFVVVGNRRQVIVHKLYAAPIGERTIARNRHEYCPAAVIRHPYDAAFGRDRSHDAARFALVTLSSGVTALPSKAAGSRVLGVWALSTRGTVGRADSILRRC